MVLRRLDPALRSGQSSLARADVDWLHTYLERLATTGFPAPQPVPELDGASWTVRGGALFELLTYLPGRPVGWSRRPTLKDVGVMLARFHHASTGTPQPSQRPVAYPLDAVSTWPSDEALRGRLDDLVADLDAVGHGARPRHVIHGDFTAHNVLARGDPPAPSGVIDFALAQVDDLIADIGFGLWRSGRPHQESVALDLNRVGDLVEGYCRLRPLPPDAARAVGVHLRARGLQQAAKAHERGLPLAGQLLARVDWVTARRSEIDERVAAAIESGC